MARFTDEFDNLVMIFYFRPLSISRYPQCLIMGFMSKLLRFLFLTLLFTGISSSAWALTCCDQFPPPLHDSGTQHCHEDPGPQTPRLHHPSCMVCCGTLIDSNYLEERLFNVPVAYPSPGSITPPDRPVYPIDEPPRNLAAFSNHLTEIKNGDSSC